MSLDQLRARHRARLVAAYRESAQELERARDEHGATLRPGFALSRDDLRSELDDVDAGLLRILGVVD
jgi:hypothetical protein